MKTFDQLFSSVFGKQEKAHDDCLLKGRITRPAKGLDDPDFEYVPSVHTSKETIWKGRETIKQ